MTSRQRALLASTLHVGGWLVLGAIGRQTSVLWFGGLAPVAAWLALGSLVAAFGGPAMLGCLRMPGPAADPATWPVLAARASLWPMMATLAVAPDWCAGLGLAPWQVVALHLGAMALPAVVLRGRRSTAGVALLMAASVVAWDALPGLRGLTVLSLLQALAWGLAWSPDDGAAPAPRPGLARRLATALLPPAAVLALGWTIATFGPDGVAAIHVGLGAVSTIGATAWLVVTARHGHPPIEARRPA